MDLGPKALSGTNPENRRPTLHQFEINLEGTKQLGVIYIAFSDKVTEAIKLEELLRAEVLLAVSALDCYVHDIVRIAWVEHSMLRRASQMLYGKVGG